MSASSHHAGIRFSSPLDAAWAAFFDGLGIAWRYQPPGLNLPSGNWYSTNFHLSELDLWVVVAEDERAFLRDGHRHAEAAFHLRTGLLVLGPVPDLQYGMPQHFVISRHDHGRSKPVLCLHVAWAEMVADRDMVCGHGLPCTDLETDTVDLPPLGSYGKGGLWTRPPAVEDWPSDRRYEDAYRAAARHYDSEVPW